MLTDDELIADLSRLRERSAGVDYTGEVPLTRRSAAATIVPVAAVAAIATVGAAALVGGDGSGPGAGSGATTAASPDAGPSGATSEAVEPGATIKLVSAEITLGTRTIAYQHAAGENPFEDGWQLALVFGDALPAGATRFDLGGGELAWVADSPDASVGESVLIVQAGPQDTYIGAPSRFSRAELEEFVRTNLRGL
jgi:hypothetical protein